MTPIRTFEEALDAIWQRSGYDRGFVSNPFAGDDAARRGLLRTQAMLDRLANPEQSCPLVHVAGSKGKGSTSMFIDAILRASGFRSGRFLSPHLHSYLERFVVDDGLISEQDFTALTADILGAAESFETESPELGAATAWELSTAMALLWFRRSQCDVAVIEVGMGGTLDATNVIDPVIAVITQLDFEHTAILGTTMAEIAGNKAGIIKRGRPVVSAAQPVDGHEVIVDRAGAANAPLYVAGRDWQTTGTWRSFSVAGPWGRLDDLQTALPGDHQVQNAGLAVAAVHTLAATAPELFSIDEGTIRTGLRSVRHPARFERLTVDSGQVVIVDGAHSPGSLAALAATIKAEYSGQRVTVVIGMLADKEPLDVLPSLLDVAASWIVVTPANPRALKGTSIAAALDQLGAPWEQRTTVADGLRAALAAGEALIVVTGSFTTAAEARVALGLDH